MPGRRDAPVSLSIILSMPAGTDPGRVHDAARSFASTLFADRHPYVFALHTDEPHPHVHLTVRAMGRDGERLNPRKADLQLWRETFAAALRDRGVEAEATPRRARGIIRKSERTPVRKLRDRFERGEGPMPDTLRGALKEAAGPPVADRAPGRRERNSGRRKSGGRSSSRLFGFRPRRRRRTDDWARIWKRSSDICRQLQTRREDSGAARSRSTGEGSIQPGGANASETTAEVGGSAFSHHADVQFRRECQVRKATRCGHS